MSDFTYTSSDCLVLRIEETDDQGEKDHTLYVLYDSYQGLYLIRGKRSNYRGKTPHTYSFETDSAKAVCEFVAILIPYYSACVFELYKYSELSESRHDITYESLMLSRNALNELVAYDHMRSTGKTLYSICSVMRKVYNDYTPDEVEEEETPVRIPSRP